MFNVTTTNKVLLPIIIVSFFAISLFTLSKYYSSPDAKINMYPSVSRIFSEVATPKAGPGW